MQVPETRQDTVIGLLCVMSTPGTLTRNSAGEKTRLEIYRIDPVSDGVPVPVRQLVGILGSDWTGGDGSVHHVRGQRGDAA